MSIDISSIQSNGEEGKKIDNSGDCVKGDAREEECNTLPSIVPCLSHNTTVRSCYCYLSRPCLTVIFGRLRTFLNYLEII